MRIQQAKAEFLPSVGYEGYLKRIEECGRVCYKSEDKITEDSAKGFVEGLIRRGHESVLEHVEYIVLCDLFSYQEMANAMVVLEENGIPVLLRRTVNKAADRCIISGNVRMWRDFMRGIGTCEFVVVPRVLHLFKGVLFDDVKVEISRPEKGCRFIQKTDLLSGVEVATHWTETARFVVDRGISHEIVRHRKASYSQESTRYCNYSAGKFGNEITVISPCFWEDHTEEFSDWYHAMALAERRYFALLDKGATPQQARDVLPQSLKTEVIMTANVMEWQHFFRLRTSPAAHPQMREVAIPLLEDACKILPGYFMTAEMEKMQ